LETQGSKSQAVCCIPQFVFLDLLFNLEDGGSMFLRNVEICPDDTEFSTQKPTLAGDPINLPTKIRGWTQIAR
jgi:hypothetical protein